jgi:hypothetical protein
MTKSSNVVVEILDLMGLKLSLRDVMRLKVYKLQIATEDQVPEGFFISGNTRFIVTCC